MRRRWLIGGLAGGLLAGAAALHFLPDMGLRYGLVEGLHRLGWAKVGVGEADLSLFNGAIVVQRIEAGAALGKALGIDGLDLRFRWKPLFSRRVSVEQLDLDGVAIDIRRDGDSFVVNGLPLAVAPSSGTGPAWTYDVTTLNLRNSRLDFADGAFAASLRIAELNIEDVKSWQPDTPARLHLRGELNGSPVSVDGTLLPFAANPSLDLQIATQGLDVERLRQILGLALTGKLDARLHLRGGPQDVQVSGTISARDARLELDAWRLAAQELDLTIAQAHWRDGNLDGQGAATLRGLSVAEGATQWLDMAEAQARDLRLSGGSGSAGKVEAKGISALSGKVQARTASLDKPSWDDESYGAASAAVTGLVAKITRTKEGIALLPPGEEGGAAPRLFLGKLRLAGKLEWEDTSLAERVRLVLDNMDATLSDLDSARPDRDSPFSVKGRVGEARLALSGKARPFAAQVEAKGDLRSLELPALSPYVADAMGVHLNTGHLDADLALSIRDRKLDGKADLTLTQLAVTPPDPKGKQPDMPLETVLDLLRDGEGRIRFALPIRGDLDNPDFDLSDAVGQAIGGALKSTLVTTFKIAFPVAALIGFVIDEAEKPHLALAPLSFAPGAEALSDDQKAKLAQIGQILTQRPGLNLTLCGIAQTREWPALAEREPSLLNRLRNLVGKPEPADGERLAALADARAQGAKAFLVEQAGIDPGRLFTCRPRLDDKGEPRVDLLL